MNFTFNEEHYLQIGGTAMGTTVAPNYAKSPTDKSPRELAPKTTLMAQIHR